MLRSGEEHRMKRMIVSIAVSGLFFSQACKAQIETGNKVELKVLCDVIRHENSFVFNYSLSNGISAAQEVFDYTIIPKGKSEISDLKVPPNWHVVFFNEELPMVRWLAEPKEEEEGYVDALKPGKSIQGFSFRSYSPPGVVDYYAEGGHNIPTFPEGMATDSIPGYSDLTPYGPGVVGKTIGPVLPQEPFVSLAFLDTLISYKHQALDLGWIKDKGIATSLDQKLDNAKAQLARNNKTSSKNILQAFIHEVEAQKDKQLTSEAYALLKFNAEYLIAKLTQ